MEVEVLYDSTFVQDSSLSRRLSCLRVNLAWIDYDLLYRGEDGVEGEHLLDGSGCLGISMLELYDLRLGLIVWGELVRSGDRHGLPDVLYTDLVCTTVPLSREATIGT